MAERDLTVISLTPGTMQNVTEILLPNVPDLFTFSEAVNFHFEYRQSGNDAIVFVPEDSIAEMVLVDANSGAEAYFESHAKVQRDKVFCNYSAHESHESHELKAF